MKDFINLPDVYVAGLLDADSEGRLFLTSDDQLQARISDPRFKMLRTYWVQVEGEPDNASLPALRGGVQRKDFPTRPASVSLKEAPPGLCEREPPVRVRKAILTAWIELGIRKGRNRQVRRMTAAVDRLTLRLTRTAIGAHTLDNLAQGSWRETKMQVEVV